MGTQANVQSIEALKGLRTALALFSEEVLSALGAVDMEIRRTVHWVQQDRKNYWQEQIKRRREAVAAAQAEVFRRKLAKTDDYTPAFSEQKELLRKAQASLQDAEQRVILVRKWEPALQHAVLEYQASRRRIKDLAAGDTPRAVAVLERLVEALEAYLRVTAPSGGIPSESSPFDSIAHDTFDAEPEAPPPSSGEEDALSLETIEAPSTDDPRH